MKSTPKSTTYEKRHTKPCRFFQKGICPLSADRCDFAHVKIQILPVKYSPGYPKPSQAEQCDHRESPQLAAPIVPIEIGKPVPATLHTVPGTETRSPEDLVTVAQPAVAKVPHGPKHYPREQILRGPASGRSPVANATNAGSAPSEDLYQLIFRGGDSSPTSDVPSLSDGDSGPPSAACEAPELTERWPGSPSIPSPMVYYNPTPGLFSPGVPFAHPAYGPWTSPKQVTRSESRKHGMSARKLKALKTKQCKFFKKDGRCPQGSLCTFIHDPAAVQASKGEEDSPSDSSGYTSQAPSEPCSGADENPGRNIFPITWRVIGGGVMMSGQREACTRYKDGVCPDGDDCPFAHPWEDEVRTPIEATSSHTSTPRASHFPPAQMAQMDDAADGSLPVPELIPDIYPVAARGRAPPSILGVREELPPRPFSTPPRINSRGDPATSVKMYRP